MVEINDDINTKAEEAYKNEKWEEFRSELFSMIKELNPNATNNDIRKRVRQLRVKIAAEATRWGEGGKAEEEVSKEKTFNTVLRKSFTYNGKPFNFSDLTEGDFSAGKLSVRKKAPQNLRGTLNDLETYSKESGDDNLIHNVEELIKLYADVILAQRGPVKEKVRIDLGWVEEVGDLPLGNWSTRKRIYDYWGKIHGKYPALKEAVDNFVDEVDDLHQTPFGGEGAFDDFFKDVGEFASWYREGLPNYVVSLPPIDLKVPDEFTNAIKIMDYFQDKQGVVSPKRRKEESHQEVEEDTTSEGAGQTGSEALEADRLADVGTPVREAGSLADPTGKRKITPPKGGIKDIEVDPIFWHKYNDDYEDLKIPKSQLNQIKKIIEGGIMDYYFDDDEVLDNFQDWFDGLKDTMEDMEKGQKNFFLPISPFITDDLDLDIKTDEITDRTTEFLEQIANLTEEVKTSFSVYQKKIEGRDKQGGGAVGELPEFMWAGKKGIDRKIPKELDKAWNEMLKAINEYYLLPLQGKNYVQAKEKPSWSKGRASLVLSIKNLKENPIGALLDKMVGEAIHSIRPKHIRNLTKFIETARSTGAKSFTKDMFSQGKNAVRALDSIFGKEFNKKNKESIGYIIYDMGKKLGVKNMKDFDNKYWSNIYSLYSNYKENRNSVDYPIDMLRHALNTPEFTAWIGLGEGKDKKIKGASEYTDKALTEAVLELDAVFDTFHKMDEINQSLLQAHDTIRKMKNKPLIHSHLSLDYIDHMDLTINKLHNEQRMDLTATEIHKIVKAVSSYESIAKNFGINEEVVYTVKAMFR
tara:strand:- start:2009 stop:4429 length:2421 start_codon:yes stop_codon:yes gene_type:complete